jgi:hypothetical protein
MSDDDFEDFLERVLTGLREAEERAVRVVSVNRYGRRGDSQYGRDFIGWLVDGRFAMWQAKAYAKFGVSDVRKAIAATPEPSDVNYIVLSCLASTEVRDEIAEHPGWEVLDARDLQDLLQIIPRHTRREILDDTFGPVVRRKLMESPGQDSVVTLQRFAEARRHPETLVNDLGAFVGRDETVASLVAALHDLAHTTVVLANGPAGRGKSRLVLEALQRVNAADPTRPVVCLALGHELTPAVIQDLPARPCTVFVDDAHRNVGGLAALFEYAKAVPGTQVVLTTRPSGVEAVRRSFADLDPARVHDLEVGPLTPREAKAFVADLTEGMDLEYSFTQWLRQAAINDPYLPVITVGLVRGAALEGSLKTSEGLREKLMTRYADITDEPIAGVAPDTVRRLVGVVSLLRRVEPKDRDSLDKVGRLVDLPRATLLRVLDALVDRGVVTDQDTGAWVVTPELLGDASADREAVAGRYDSGFASEVWQAFSADRFDTLFPAMAELGWRVKERHELDVVADIWNDARAFFANAEPDAVLEALQSGDALPIFDAERSLRILSDLHGRFLPSRAQGQPTRRSWSDPLGSEDVLQALAPLLGRVAKQDTALLPEVLDLLWALRRSDAREPHREPEHPARVMAEGPGDPSAQDGGALALLDAAERWLATPPAEDGVTTPLDALHSVIAKEGSRTRQTDGKSIQLQSWLLPPEAVREVRDRVRALAAAHGPGLDVRRAAAATKLLGDMLHSPRGLYGAQVPPEVVLAWADDDLESLRVLSEIAESTRSGTVRRLIRHEIEYVAESAADARVRHVARVLAVDLDNREDDDLAELLLHEWSTDLSRRGQAHPTLDEVQGEIDSELAATSEEADTARTDRIARRVEQRDVQRDALTQWAVDVLMDLPLAEALSALRVTAADVAVVKPGQTSSLWGLYQRVRSAYPDRAEALVRALDAGEPGPLDDQAAILLEAWVDTDQQALLDWASAPEQRRPETRRAIGVFLTNHDPNDLLRGWDAVRSAGLNDPDPAVQPTFLLTLHRELAQHPAKAVQSLIAAGASAWVCQRALDAASSRDGAAWGQTLSEDDGAAVLLLIDRIGWSDWTAQHAAAGIASNHPATVLTHLAGVPELWRLGHGEASHLTAAFTKQAPAVIDWLLQNAADLPHGQSRDLMGIVLGETLDPALSSELIKRAVALSADDLEQTLGSLQGVQGWPQQEPDLARALLHRARGVDRELAALEGLAHGMRPWMVSGVNGESEELTTAIVAARAAAGQETDDGLRSLFEQAVTDLTAMAERDRARHEEDEDLL